MRLRTSLATCSGIRWVRTMLERLIALAGCGVGCERSSGLPFAEGLILRLLIGSLAVFVRAMPIPELILCVVFPSVAHGGRSVPQRYHHEHYSSKDPKSLTIILVVACRP